MRRMNAASLFALVVGLVCLGISSGRQALAQTGDALVLVANPTNTAASGMSKSDVKKLLLGEVVSWPNGTKVVVVLRPAASPERIAVLKKVCGMSEADYTRHNLQAAFIGGTAPAVREAPSAAALQNFVKANPGAMGFVRKSEVTGDVKSALTLD